MEFKRLSDDQLVASTEQQFAIERKTSHYIFLHLKEIYVRRVYAKRGFPNLRDMLIKHFRQSETAANQRLKSLELMFAVPVVEERLISGDLNMSTVAMAQRQILLEEKLTGNKVSKEKKAEIVESITNKTMAKAEIELFKLLPETASHPQTYERRVSEDATRLNLTMPNDVMEMMIRLKEIWAHVDPRMDPVEVIRRSFKITLQKVDPSLAKRSSKKGNVNLHENAKGGSKGYLNQNAKADSNAPLNYKAGSTLEADKEELNRKVDDSNKDKVDIELDVREDPNQKIKAAINCNFEQDGTAKVSSTNKDIDEKTDLNPHKPTQSLTDSVKHRGTKRPTYYSKATDRALWRRAGCQCEFTDEKTGRRCPSRFGLQREHVIPLALGGSNDLSNMQLLCFTHNQLRARQVFGDKKIDSHQAQKNF